jgi:thermitase
MRTSVIPRTFATAALLAVCIPAFAQPRQVVGPVGRFTQVNFVEQPGVMEFTGEMIVRPVQAEVLARLGRTVLQAAAMRQQIEIELADHTIEYRAVTDEFIIRVPEHHDENSFSRQLMATGRYQYAEPNWRVFPLYTPNDPQLGQQWSHTNSDSRDAWDVQRGSDAVIVAITDTGVHLTHEDFNFPATNLVSGYNSVNNLPQSAGGQVQDINGHGTHCAGIAAAIGDNSRGVAGVSLTGTKIMPVRVSNTSGGSSSIAALTGGILWAAQNGARVTSTSYSGYNSSSVGTTGTTCKNTYNSLSHWAAGNSGAFISGADWADVVIVGATNSSNARASFSNYGTDVDLMAPGDNIRSTYWTGTATNTYANLSGTSMACPFAAGLSGLIIAQNPTYSAQRVEDVLFRSCVDMGNVTNFGWGRTNVYNAVGRKPNSYNLPRGFFVSGALADLFRAEGNTLNVNRGVVANLLEAPIQVRTLHNSSFTTVTEVNVQVTAKVSAAGGLSGRIELLNKNTGQYDVVATATMGTSFAKIEATVSGANAMNYVNSGIIDAKFSVFKSGPTPGFNWQANVDQIVVRTLR